MFVFTQFSTFFSIIKKEFVILFAEIPVYKGAPPSSIQHDQSVDLSCMISHRQYSSHRYVSTSQFITYMNMIISAEIFACKLFRLLLIVKPRLNVSCVGFICRTSKFSSNRHRKLQPFRET